MQIRIITSDDVKAAFPMPKAIEIMKHAFGQLSAGKASVPLRSKISSDIGKDWLFSNRVLCTRLQPQRLKHRRAFAFSAYGRKFKPPASRVVVDSCVPAGEPYE